MPILKNPRHEAFAQYLYEGHTADEAYQRAGFKPNRGNATRLKANESILQRVEELQERKAKQADVTVESITARLNQNIALAEKLGQPAAINGALQLMAKLRGLIIDHAKVESDNTTWLIADKPMNREDYERAYTENTLGPAAGAANPPHSLPH